MTFHGMKLFLQRNNNDGKAIVLLILIIGFGLLIFHPDRFVSKFLGAGLIMNVIFFEWMIWLPDHPVQENAE